MSYSSDALQALRAAEKVDGAFPWNLVLLLSRAVVSALLAIAVAIEEHRQ